MANNDLLKEAIADAKAVRETALQNAKIALEEAFTPRLQSMLSNKIRKETEDYEEDDVLDTEEDEEEVPTDVPADVTPEKDVDVDVGDDEVAPEEDYYEEDEVEDEFEGEVGDYEEGEEDEVIEINGVKYAPVVSEEEDELDENDVSSDIGNGDNKQPGKANDSSNVGTGPEKPAGADSPAAGHENPEDEELDDLEENLDINAVIKELEQEQYDKSTEDGYDEDAETPEHDGLAEGEEEETEEDEETVDEVLDLDEILDMLGEGEEDTEEEEDEVTEKVTALESELEEHRNVVKYLKDKLNEVNLLNAKLLYTNKLMKSFQLNNGQKMKVIETFDRASNLREVKLVYSTLAESLVSSAKGIVAKPKKSISEGRASKPVKSTKPKKTIISEGDKMASRMKKLAGLI
tara:strand:- start:43 stop:1257 length:1215 start_codon:yes stop_codon:yes gene_type:complete